MVLPRNGWHDKSSLAALLVSLLLATAHYLTHADFTTDDAGITYAYAENLADGNGLGQLYPNAPRVEGYSNFLWLLLLAGGAHAGISPLVFSKVLGLALTLGSVMLVNQLARNLVSDRRVVWGSALFPLPWRPRSGLAPGSRTPFTCSDPSGDVAVDEGGR